LNKSDKETVIRLLKTGFSPTKICDNTPFPYEFVKREYDKIKALEESE